MAPYSLLMLTRDYTALPCHSRMRALTREISLAMPLFLTSEHHRTLAGTHFPSRRWSKAELACVAGYIRRWFVRPKTVTHPSTNRAQRTATWLMCLTPLPPRQIGTVYYYVL